MESTVLASTFGTNVFNDTVMRQRLPKHVYRQLKGTIDDGMALDPAIAEAVAAAMKDWAIELGATHFTHWFQPLTGITAEKHDSFLIPGENGTGITEFSGKELIKGEPDASSFPSGGLRMTFEARGYTAWDCTSPAFVKGTSLYIPTAFCSYTGVTLDLKTPLLRSMEVISTQALRILRLFGDYVTKRVMTTVGAEQEYFLVDKEMYLKRPDLLFTGRTLFGAPAPKGQELDDQYFGAFRDRVADYMHELDTTLWKMGVAARTKHNEAAPAQHELAPVYTTTNIATDQNQLMMDTMRRVADKHGLACLLHEKPFAGINGSGKHNNWSLATDGGINLLNPGYTPDDNAQFLVFLAAVIKAVDEYAGLLRLSIATAGNDHRLGANEAPPAIISVYLGDELTAVLEQIETGVARTNGHSKALQIGVSTLPSLPLDSSDRNRTSPFAFTGNKFEFRSVGASSSIAMANCVLNTIVAESLSLFADRLESADDLNAEIAALVRETYVAHKRIIFNGNNYAQNWVAEAEGRGLKNLCSTVDAAPEYLDPKNIAVFEKHKVLCRAELESRYEILLESYINTTNIEARTALEIANRRILPAVIRAIKEVAETVAALKAADADTTVVGQVLTELNTGFTDLKQSAGELEQAAACASAKSCKCLEKAKFCRDQVMPKLEGLRATVDGLECIVESTHWPMPTYADLLFTV